MTIGNGDVVRDFLHVSDVVDAYLALLERGVPGEVYNVCSGEGASVRAARRVVSCSALVSLPTFRPIRRCPGLSTSRR